MQFISVQHIGPAIILYTKILNSVWILEVAHIGLSRIAHRSTADLSEHWGKYLDHAKPHL